MIFKKHKSLKFILACSAAFMVQSCSGDGSSQEQMEVSQDEQSAEISEDGEAVAEESLAQSSDEMVGQEESIAYDENASAPIENSELDKSLDDVLDQTFGSQPETAPVSDDYASGEEMDSGMSIPAMDEAPAPVAKPKASKSVVAKAASDSAAAQSSWNPTSVSGETFAYIVQPGETLGSISRKVFGNSDRWQDIANHSKLQNPHMIFPGDELQVPVDSSSQQFVNNLQNMPKQQVVVREGDTLAKIAEQHFGNAASWAVIWKQNQDIIKNPNTILPGQTLAFLNYSQVAH